MKEVDIGFGARRALAGLSTEVNVNFRKEAKEILQSICSKIQERSPLKYSLIKYVSCFNPQIIWTQPEECQRRLKGVCNVFLDANRIATTAADKAKQSWNDLVSTEDFKVNSKNYCKLSRSDPDKRLDLFYREHLSEKEEYNDLYNLVKMVMVLSHGNAEAERGFSVNRQILQDNMMERSMVAQRIVHQALAKTGGKVTDVTIDKQMMSDVRLASRRRIEYLDAKRQQKSEEEHEADRKKRKAATIKELEARSTLDSPWARGSFLRGGGHFC